MSLVSTQVIEPSASDFQKPGLESTGSDQGALKVFEPALKNPVDQLNATLARIDEIKNQQHPAENYANAFSPDKDAFFIQTGNANVTQAENLNAMFSTPPEGERQSEYGIFIVIGFVALGIYLLKGKI